MEEELNILCARINFCDTCVNELNREFPRYLTRNTEYSKAARGMSLALKNVASSEPDEKLQEFLFALAKKYDILENESDIKYKECHEKCVSILNRIKSQMIAPLKEVVNEGRGTFAAAKKINLEINQDDSNPFGISRAASRNLTTSTSHQDKNYYLLLDKLDMLKQLIPIHAHLFEKHRLSNLKKLLDYLLHSELSYHIRAVEELSDAMGILSKLDSEGWEGEDSQSDTDEQPDDAAVEHMIT